MSTNTFDTALDFLPESKSRTDQRHGKSLFALIVEALSEARAAEAEYGRQVARGVTPSKAAEAAFKMGYRGH